MDLPSLFIAVSHSAIGDVLQQLCLYLGYIYVCGGSGQTDGPFFLDFWRVNLRTTDGWQQLPMFDRTSNLDLTECGFAIRGHLAFFFEGSLDLQVFNLEKSRWFKLSTTFQPDQCMKYWFPNSRLRKFAIQCVNGRIYVFGGKNMESLLGCDLLLELDLVTRQWRRISGSYPSPKASFAGPGPRVGACSWVNPDKSKIFIMNGHADLLQAGAMGQYVPSENHMYDDIWSWDLAEKRWTKEKSHGNRPAPRSEMAAIYVRIAIFAVSHSDY